MKKQQYIYAGIGVLIILIAVFAIKKTSSPTKEQLSQDAEDLLRRIDEVA